MFAIPNIQPVRWGGGASAAASLITARYWRAKLIGSGLQDHTALAQFVPSWAGAGSATITASETAVGTDVANLSDSSQSTKWETTAGFTIAYLTMDLGVGNTDTLTAISLQQTNEGDAVNAHPAGLILQWSDVGGATEDDWVDYCVLLTQVSGVSAALVEYGVTADAQAGNDFYLNADNDYWGFIVVDPTQGAKMAEVDWQTAAGASLGTVSSHVTKSATLTPANLYDDLSTESTFEAQAHPQLVSTLFTAAIAPRQVNLTGAAVAADSWTNFYIIAGPDATCQQIVSEVDRTWTVSEVVDIDVRKPKVIRNAIIHHEVGEWTADQWDDTIAYNGTARHLIQGDTAKQPTPNTTPTRLTFDNVTATERMSSEFLPLSARSLLTIFKRPTATWTGLDDASGAPAATETKISGGEGGVGTLGVYDGLLLDTESFFIDGTGWDQDPTTTSIAQDTWVAAFGTDAAASEITGINAAHYGAGGASVDWAEIVVLGDVDVSKKGPTKNIQKYAVRIIEAVKAS